MIPTNIATSPPFVRLGGDTTWIDLFTDRSGFQREFVRLVSACPQLGGRVLDIGCGSRLPKPLQPFLGRLGTLDGVDPDASVAQHPLLAQRWESPFETSPAPREAYDLAYAYNVLEHITDPLPFFRKVYSVLKPGGVFWGLTPNWWHPFALLSRSIERIGLKSFARDKVGTDPSGAMRVNNYPAYYRCNTPPAIRRAIRGLGFQEATFYFHPCLQWDTYFPRWLRWAPRTYDYVLGIRVACLLQTFIVRLDKQDAPPDS